MPLKTPVVSSGILMDRMKAACISSIGLDCCTGADADTPRSTTSAEVYCTDRSGRTVLQCNVFVQYFVLSLPRAFSIMLIVQAEQWTAAYRQ